MDGRTPLGDVSPAASEVDEFGRSPTVAPSPKARVPYDAPDYVHSLSHLGTPLVLPELPCGFVERPIPGSARRDAIGPWPYVTPWTRDEAALVVDRLRRRGNVTLSAVFRPDAPVDSDGLARVGIACRPLKPHYVREPGGRPPPPSRRTRRNLSRSRRHWAVGPVDLETAWAEVAEVHAAVSRRRPGMSTFTDPPADHFRVLASLAGMRALGAYDADGLGAALLYAESDSEIHCHLLGGGARSLRFGAAYTLFEHLESAAGAARTIYFGGAPAGPAGEGIARFKRRFATAERPVILATVILDEVACGALAKGRDAGGYFPPYRG